MSEKDPLADLPWPGCHAAPSAQISDSIRKQCTQGMCAKRGVSSTGRVLMTLGVSAVMLGFFVWYAVMDHKPGPLLRTTLFGAAGWLGVQAMVLAVGLARPPGTRCPKKRMALLVGLPVLFLVYLFFAATEHFAFSHFAQGYPVRHALGCGLVAFFFSSLVTGAAMVAWRRTDPYSPGLSGALLGLVGGLAGAAGIGVACPSHEVYHLWFAHGLVVVALCLIGFGLGRRVLTP